jgi:hypothetical protein
VVVRQTFVTLVRLVQLGENPFLRLLGASNLERIREAFRFGSPAELQHPEGGNPLVRFTHGALQLADGSEVAIPRLQLEPRKLIIEVAGTSEEGREIYHALASLLVQLLGISDEVLEEPLLETDESIIVANLSFAPDALYPPGLKDAVDAFVHERGGFEFAEAFVLPAMLGFDIDYVPRGTAMAEKHIALTRKELSIRPKIGYELSQHVYESKAPLDTDTHLEFLELLENSLAKR